MQSLHAWLDVTAGVAGDMLLAAVLDAGAPLDGVQAAVDAVAPQSVRLGVRTVERAGQRAVKAGVEVLVADPPHRLWRTIRADLQGAALHPRTRAWALAVFERLARAEAHVHGIDPEEVHFHEVGALDSIADVVGVCEGLRLLGVTSVSASPVTLGAGRVRAAHGDLPVPVPAVAQLAIGWQVLAAPQTMSGQPAASASTVSGPGHAHGGLTHAQLHAAGIAHDHHEGDHGAHGHPHDHDAHAHGDLVHHDQPAPLTTPGQVGELATPTGLAIVRALADTCENLPTMRVTGIGVGAGGKDIPGRPNVVRVVLGEVSAPTAEMVEVLTNVDDLDPRLLPGVIDALLAAGAKDAWLVPIVMKKGRPAVTIHALCERDALDAVSHVLLTNTSTLGVRWWPVARTTLDRAFRQVPVDGIPVTIKIALRDGVILHAAAEFESVASAALTLGRSEFDVLRLAEAAAVAGGLAPGAHLPEDF